MILEQKEAILKLYEIYYVLLTQKQCQVMERYFYEDFSINEIGEELNITKTAVFNQIERIIKKLETFEEKLQLNQKNILLDELQTKYKISKKEIEEVLN